MAGLALAGQMGAQHQYLDVNVGGGLQSLQHDPRLGDCTPGWGGNLNVGYTFYFSRHWGVGTGLGLAYYQAQSKIDGLDESKETDVVNNNRTYYLRNYYDGWEEHQQMLVGELPLGLYYRTDLGRHTQLVAGAGCKLTLPVWNKYKVEEGQVETQGYYPDRDLLIYDLPHHGFGTDCTRYSGDVSTRLGAQLYADLGLRRWLKNGLGLYAGLYAGYGLTDAVEDHDVKLHDAEGNYHGVLASNQVDGVTLVSAGLKIGITLPLGKRPVAPVDTPKVLPDTALPPVVKKDTVAVDSELARAVALADSLPDKKTFGGKDKPALSRADSAYDALTAEQKAKYPADRKRKLTDLKDKVDKNSVARLNSLVRDHNVQLFLLDSPAREFTPDEDIYMESIVECLFMNPEASLEITGYSCDLGSYEHDKVLGLERAKFIREHFVQLGANSEQIEVRSFGKDDPILPNTSEENRVQNRRAVIKVLQ